MPSRQQVRALVEQGVDYASIGRRLGVAPGQAYLVGTGLPADGGVPDPASAADRPGALTSAQHLVGPPAENPTTKKFVHDWIKTRVASDAPMQAAARGRRAADSEG